MVWRTEFLKQMIGQPSAVNVNDGWALKIHQPKWKCKTFDRRSVTIKEHIQIFIIRSLQTSSTV